MFKNLLRSMTTIALLAVVAIIQVIILFQNNNIESQNIEAKKQAENAPATIQTVVASGDSNIKGTYAPYAFAFDDPSNLLTLDSEEWLPEDATKSGVLLSYLTSDPKGLNFLTQNGSDVSALQNYISVGLMRRHFSDTTKWHPELAYHMSRTEDYLTYTFKIRQDVYWHVPTLDIDDPQYAWLKEGKPVVKVTSKMDAAA